MMGIYSQTQVILAQKDNIGVNCQQTHYTNAGLMLAHRLRRWANIKPASGCTLDEPE